MREKIGGPPVAYVPWPRTLLARRRGGPAGRWARLWRSAAGSTPALRVFAAFWQSGSLSGRYRNGRTAYSDRRERQPPDGRAVAPEPHSEGSASLPDGGAAPTTPGKHRC